MIARSSAHFPRDDWALRRFHGKSLQLSLPSLSALVLASART